MRGERKQRSAPLAYVLPAWRKKLKGQLPDNITEATKLHPIKASGLVCANNVEIAAGADSSFPLEGREPRFKRGRQRKGLSKLLPRGSRKKRFVLMDCKLICDSGLHESKSGKDRGISRAKGKRLTV